MELEVRDNGVGWPADVDLAQAKSLGLRTVYILAKRLNATVDVGNDGGSRFTLTFPREAEGPVEPRPEAQEYES